MWPLAGAPRLGLNMGYVEDADLLGAPHSLPLAIKLRLAVEIALSYVQVRWLLSRGGLESTVRRVRVIPRRVPLALRDPVRDGQRLGRAVQRTLAPLPANTLCLMQSLVLMRLLARRRAMTRLVIAVRPGGGLGLDAHAWIELDGTPLLAPAGRDFGQLVAL